MAHNRHTDAQGRAVLIRAAYSPECKTEDELRNAWAAGKDFKILNGPYCSIRDSGQLAGHMGCTEARLVDALHNTQLTVTL